MIPLKKSTSRGVITFHAPLSDDLLKTQECTTEQRDDTESIFLPSVKPRRTSRCVRARKTDAESPSRPKLSPKQNRVSHPSFRQLQAEMEAESQQAREIIKPLMDTENGFVKDLEKHLSRWDETRLRKRELLHKRWTDRVWFPLHSRVEEHVSMCSAAEAKRRQGLYSHFLHHCNTKGFVFLETYDPKEYNPFLVNIKKPHYFKLNKDKLKEPLYVQLHKRLEEKGTVSSYKAGCKYTTRQPEKVPEGAQTFTEPVMVQANTPLQAVASYPGSASRKNPVGGEIEGKTCSRIQTLPYHLRGTASTDGKCHRSGCWFSSSLF